MNYNAHDAFEDGRALASLIDHHHVPHHIMIDSSFTYMYDYAVSVDIGSKMKKIVHCWRTKCLHNTWLQRLHHLFNIFREESNGQARVTKKSYIVSDCIFSVKLGETNLTCLQF